VKIPQMIAAEFRRLTATRLAVIALIALTLVPVLYGGLYLWANQDPYARLDQVPVALVVSDTGTTVDGVEENYGDEVAKEILDDGTFDWHRVSASHAEAGVDDSTYDFSVTLPADFSESLASASGDTPHQAEVVLTTNDANSYLSTTIGQDAAHLNCGAGEPPGCQPVFGWALRHSRQNHRCRRRC
jgi:putative membrane protein